jgi:hypothetical protein
VAIRFVSSTQKAPHVVASVSNAYASLKRFLMNAAGAAGTPASIAGSQYRNVFRCYRIEGPGLCQNNLLPPLFLEILHVSQSANSRSLGLFGWCSRRLLLRKRPRSDLHRKLHPEQKR